MFDRNKFLFLNFQEIFSTIKMFSIEGILQKASNDELKAQQLVNVDSKQIDLTYDLAHLAAFDPNLYPDLKTLK